MAQIVVLDVCVAIVVLINASETRYVKAMHQHRPRGRDELWNMERSRWQQKKEKIMEKCAAQVAEWRLQPLHAAEVAVLYQTARMNRARCRGGNQGW